jgi:sugar phosphate isomerase/epimerase
MLKLATKFAPRRDAFEAAYRAGFRCAELWLDASVLADWQHVACLAAHYSFEYALHFPNGPDLPPEAPEQAVRLARALGSRCLVIHQPMLDRYGEALLRRDPSLRLAVENHELDPEGFVRWAEDNRGLALDVEHLWLLTLQDAPLAHLLDEVEGFLRRYGPKLCHVHLLGYWPGFRTHRPLYCAREMVFPVLTLLAEHGFKGLVVSEADKEYQNPAELRMDVLLFEAWRDQHEPGPDGPRPVVANGVEDRGR